jgi:hypothetical protein
MGQEGHGIGRDPRSRSRRLGASLRHYFSTGSILARERIRVERVEPLGPDRYRVTYTYSRELGGKIPAWAEEKAWREEPVQYIRAIRRRLKLPDPSEGRER